ncbi:SDR family NAD(P)-dependent oxidoreductase [Viscerimonas tarda]
MFREYLLLMHIQGKNIVLTGASSGIGEVLLGMLAQYEDVKIVAVARHTGNIPLHNGQVYPFAADLSTQEGVDALFEYTKSIGCEIDLFIANAGFGYLEKLDKPDWKHIKDIFSLNVFSAVYSLEKLALSNNSKPRSFVSVISCAGLVSLPAYSLYCASKAALHHFMQTYRYESPTNLHIVSVYPVATRTAFFDKAANATNTPLPYPAQSAEKVAKAIIQGIEKDKKNVFPLFIFRLFYSVGRLCPFLLRVYSYLEKRKVEEWLR